MTMTIKAHFDGHAIIPDQPVDLPLNQTLVVQVETTEEPVRSITGEGIAKSGLVGLWKDRTDIGDSLEFARELRRQAEIRGGGRG